MVYRYFDIKISGSGVKSESMPNQQLTEELHKLIIRKFEKRKVHSSFMDKIWGADLAPMQLITTSNKGIRFLLYVINIFSKYTKVVSLKYKKTITIANAFQKTLDKTNRKLKKKFK